MGTRVRQKFALCLSRAVTKLSSFRVYAFSSEKLNGQKQCSLYSILSLLKVARENPNPQSQPCRLKESRFLKSDFDNFMYSKFFVLEAVYPNYSYNRKSDSSSLQDLLPPPPPQLFGFGLYYQPTNDKFMLTLSYC